MPPTRRQLLLSGLVLAPGCTSERRADPAPRPSLDDRLRDAAVVREEQLLQAYVDAMAEQPRLASRLAAGLGDHTAHLLALAPGSAIPAPRPAKAPRSPAAVLRDLARLERTAAAAHATGAERVETEAGCSRELAPLLASLAASEASHAVLLT